MRRFRRFWLGDNHDRGYAHLGQAQPQLIALGLGRLGAPAQFGDRLPLRGQLPLVGIRQNSDDRLAGTINL